MAVEISQPFRVFTDVDGEPLEDGFIHIGAVNQNPQVVPISVFFDVALTIPAAQPIRTLGGYPSRTGTPSRLYVAEAEYSISVSNKNSTLIYSSLDSDNPLAETGSPSNGAALIARGDQIVNSIADLRALLKTSASKFAFVNGYYAAGDGGGGQYYLDAADTTSADNGGTIIVATDGGRWKLIVTGQVSVKQFGAKGDGTSGTNDSLAIQNAATWSAANKATLLFPKATYRLLSFVSIPSNSDWLGEVGTVIYLDPAMTLGTVIGGTARGVFANIVNDISIAKIKFKSIKTGLTQAVTVCLSGVVRLRIEDCAFEDFGNATFYAQGLIVFGSSDVRVTGSRFYNNSGDGLAFSNNTINYVVSGNEFSTNADWGFALVDGCNYGIVQENIIRDNTSTGTGVDRCSNVTFVGNNINNNEHGIRIAEFTVSTEKNSHISIIGNNIVTSGVAGVSIEDMKAAYGNYTVVGNTIEGSSGQGIRIHNTELGTIVGNTIYSVVNEAILFNANTAGRNTGTATVSNNKIQNCTFGVRQLTGAGTTARITVSGNDIGVASSGLVSLTNADYIEMSNSNYFDMSKTLNFPSGITSFTATAGATAQPANVQGFLPFYMGGILRKIPFYNA